MNSDENKYTHYVIDNETGEIILSVENNSKYNISENEKNGKIKLCKKMVDDMLLQANTTGIIDTNMLYAWCKITKEINDKNQIKLLGSYTDEYTQKQLLEDFTILGYIMRIVDKTHNFSSIVMKNRKTPIKNWGELWELINCNKPQTQSKVKKYLLDNKILKTMKISSMSNKLETRFILNPFLFRGANYSSQLAIILFSEYIKEDINISTYPLRWLESLGYITR